MFQPSLIKGKVVIVYFMTTWCFSCLGDMPMLVKLHSQFSSQGLVIVGVGLDLEGAKTLAPYVKSQNIPFPMLVADSSMIGGNTAFGPIRGVPATYIFDRNAKLVAAFHGTPQPQMLIDKVSKLVRDDVLQH